MKIRLWPLVLIILGALVLRFALAQSAEHPGIADPNHYYNMGYRLAHGQGFTVNYIWQFNNDYATITHPEDYWMPLTSLIVAAAMKIFGTGVQAAFVPFILLGAVVLPILAYLAARQMRCSEATSLFAAAAVAFLPELVMNSLRTDTTLINAALITAAIMLLTVALRRGGRWPFVGVGIAGGLAYLTRSDSSLLLPMIAVTMLVYWRWGRAYVARWRDWRYIVLVPVIAGVLVAPWIVRNIRETGSPTSASHMSNMFFLTDYRDHYVYSTKLSLTTLLDQQTPRQLIGKRLFEMAASLKIMITSLDMFLPVAVAGGLLLLLAARDRDRLLTLAPTLILLGGFFAFYTLLVPFKSQGGSFKKTYLSVIPLLVPLAAYARERAIPDQRFQRGAMILVLMLMTVDAVELTRADIQKTNSFLATMRRVAQTVKALPDTNHDGEIVLMTQDPFIMGFLGLRSVIIPMENRATILEVAQRYGVDYLMMPPDRPALDPIYNHNETDPRFVAVTSIPGTAIEIYRFDFSADAPPAKD
jgi:hypothetical protein